jgi:hypothetical protein
MKRARDTSCARCGRGSHDIGSCFARTDSGGSPIFDRASARPRGASASHCARCGRSSHTAAACFARARVDGAPIATGSGAAAPAGCSSTAASAPAPSSTPAASLAHCTRCGRSSHAAAACFARARVDGAPIATVPAAPVGCSFCDKAGHVLGACPRMLPFGHPRRSHSPPPRGRRVVNIQGSSWDLPECASWRAQAEEFLGPETKCVVLGCDGSAEEGCHVFVEGDRDHYFIARMCRKCNHRHGSEEMCYHRFVEGREDPRAWIPIRDVWLYKIGGPGGSHWGPFRDWCKETTGPSHGARTRCSGFCVGGR